MKKGLRQLIGAYVIAICSLSAQEQAKVKTLTEPFDGNGSIAISDNGTIYINEYGIARADISGSGNRIFELMPDGKTLIVKDDVSGAVGNTFDKAGNYYFNNGNSMISSTLMRLSVDGVLKEIAEIKGFSGDLLISSDEKSILMPSYTRPVITQVLLNGEVNEYVTDERLKGSTGIVYGDSDELFVSNFSTGFIYTIDINKNIEELAKVPVVYPGYVIGYITYFEGHLYATGYGSNRIYKISVENGKVDEYAGNGEYASSDGDFDNSSFVTPNGIEIDKKNRRLIISQNGNGKPASLRAVMIE